jgi:WD40 repeat protein
MTTWLPRWNALLVLVLLSVPVVAADPDGAEIARLVKQLGDDEFEKRGEATTRLKEIGEPALDALHQAKTSNDAEVRRRAEDIFAVIEHKVYGDQLCLTGHAGTVWKVSLSADGKLLLTSGTDKTLRLWDTDTGECLRVFEGHTDGVIGAALSPDGKRVLSGSQDNTVRLWDATTGKELRQMIGHTDSASRVAFGPEGQALSGGADRTMRLWDLNTGKNAGVFTVLTWPGYSFAYSAKAKLAATGSNQLIRLWNLETGKEVRQLIVHSGKGNLSVYFSPDGKLIASVNEIDHTVRIWDVETGKERKQIPVPNAYCVAFSPDGKRLVSGSFRPDNTVRVWDIETGKELCKYEGHTAPVVSVAFFPDGKRIASASVDGTARTWRAPR